MVLTALLCIVPALALPRCAQAKAPDGIEIAVEVGYDGFVQQGRINPVIVDLKNNSAGTSIQGELVLRYNDIEYITDLNLPTPSEKRIFLYFPCDNYSPYLTLQVRSRQWTEAFDLNQLFKSSRAADTSILVISNQSGELGVLNQLDTVRLHRNLYVNASAAVDSSRTFVSYVRLDQVDPNPKYFARADVVVLGGIDYNQVTPQLAEALKACTAGGTSIVFSLGLNGAGIANSALAELCPLRASGTVQLSNLGDLSRRYGIESGGMQATYAVGELAPGAVVVADSGGVPAVVRQQWGGGTVTALAFDYTARPFRQNPQLGALFLDTLLAVPENVEVRNWFIHPEPLTKILQRLQEADPMPPHFVLLFLAAYIVLVGPVNFLLLRTLKRQTLVWTTIPLIIGSFAYGGLETGRLTRGSDNVTSTFQEMHIYPGASYTPYQNVKLIFTAERTRYELTVPDKSAFLFAGIPQQLEVHGFSGNSPARQFRGLTQGQLDNTAEPRASTTQGKWTSKEYFYQGYANLPVKLSTSIRAQRMEQGAGNAAGSFTLDLPFDLEMCYLHGGTGSKYLGRLAGQGTYDIAALQQLGQSPAQDAAGTAVSNYLLAARTEISELQRGATARALLYRDELLLVGFTDQVPVLAEFKVPHKSYQLSMVVLHLPFTPVKDAQAAAETRCLLTGGAGLEVNVPWGYGAKVEEQLEFAANGYADLGVQLLGQATSATRLTLRTSATLDRNTPVERLTDHLDLFVWSREGWQPLRPTLTGNALDIPLGGIAAPDGSLRLRLVSRTEGLKLSMPRTEAYGSR